MKTPNKIKITREKRLAYVRWLLKQSSEPARPQYSWNNMCGWIDQNYKY